jgi:hypothetical protein
MAHLWKNKNAYKILVGKSEGQRKFRKPRHRWENMKMDSKEIAGKVDDWINLAQNREGGGMF